MRIQARTEAFTQTPAAVSDSGSATMSRSIRCIVQALAPGSALMPPNFPARLRALKELTGLSWYGFAEKVGVDPRQIVRWMKGVEPSGASMMSLFRVASAIPGGISLLLHGNHPRGRG